MDTKQRRNVAIPAALHSQLKALAASKGTNLRFLVERAVRALLARKQAS